LIKTIYAAMAHVEEGKVPLLEAVDDQDPGEATGN